MPPTPGVRVAADDRRPHLTDTPAGAERADYLRRVPAAMRLISAEPLLGPLDSLDLSNIDWLIAGGESGRGHRPMNVEWARELRDRCAVEGVAFFFKQWGGATAKSGGRSLDGEEHSEMPAVAGVTPGRAPRGVRGTSSTRCS